MSETRESDRVLLLQGRLEDAHADLMQVYRECQADGCSSAIGEIGSDALRAAWKLENALLHCEQELARLTETPS